VSAYASVHPSELASGKAIHIDGDLLIETINNAEIDLERGRSPHRRPG
jgi:hypothetical protein